MTETNEKERRWLFAEEIAATGGVQSSSVLRAFATVPRERFLPPGPWIVEAIDGFYYRTRNDDITHVLHAVGVALDVERKLNSANPARIGRSLESAEFRPGEEVLHVGAGMGYFSAIIAELVGPDGRVLAAEIDKRLAHAARDNLSAYPNVTVIGDALSCPLPPVDVVFVSAGTPVVPRRWIDALRPGGRMVLPLTGSTNVGFSYCITKLGDSPWLPAQPREMVRFYPCVDTREPQAIAAVDAATADPRWTSVKSLRLDPHERDTDCWLHGDGWCLTLASPPT